MLTYKISFKTRVYNSIELKINADRTIISSASLIMLIMYHAEISFSFYFASQPSAVLTAKSNEYVGSLLREHCLVCTNYYKGVLCISTNEYDINNDYILK